MSPHWCAEMANLLQQFESHQAQKRLAGDMLDKNEVFKHIEHTEPAHIPRHSDHERSFMDGRMVLGSSRGSSEEQPLDVGDVGIAFKHVNETNNEVLWGESAWRDIQWWVEEGENHSMRFSGTKVHWATDPYLPPLLGDTAGQQPFRSRLVPGPKKHTVRLLVIEYFVAFSILSPIVLALGDLEAVRESSNVPYLIAKVLALSISAMASFSTGITAYLLGISNDPSTTKQSPDNFCARLVLRVISALTLMALLAGYALWFLRLRPDKAHAFMGGAALCAIVLWLIVRGGEDSETNQPMWLDMANLIGFAVVTAGILNAESGLLGALVSRNQRRCPSGAIVEQRDSQHYDEQRAPGHNRRDPELVPIRRITAVDNESSTDSRALEPPEATATLHTNNPTVSGGGVGGADTDARINLGRYGERNGIYLWLGRFADVISVTGFFSGS